LNDYVPFLGREKEQTSYQKMKTAQTGWAGHIFHLSTARVLSWDRMQQVDDGLPGMELSYTQKIPKQNT